MGRRGSFQGGGHRVLGAAILAMFITSCTSHPVTVSRTDSVAVMKPPQTSPAPSGVAGVTPPSLLPTATAVPRESPSPRTIPPTPTAAPPALIATDSVADLSQTYTNPREQYVVSLPPDWTVVTSDVGTAYFLNHASRAERAQGRTEWEASIGGIQFVGRQPKPTETEQYESSLPNHCAIVDWQPVTITQMMGRIYTLECDHPLGTGTHRRQHVYIPVGNRFVEFWLNVEPAASGPPVPLLEAIVSTLQLHGSSS